MNPTHMIQSLLSGDRVQKPTNLSIRPGQVIHGKVEKLFPTNTALVQVGSLRLHAQIEAPIEANQRYWFEAQLKNNELVLKVLDPKIMNQLGAKDSISSLLGQFQLPDTKLNTQLLQFLLSSNLPFTKEQLVSASQWIKETKQPSVGMVALEMLINKNLPFTKESYKAMVAFQNPSSLSTQIENVMKVLDHPRHSNSESVVQLREFMVKLFEGSSLKSGQRALDALVEQWVSPKSTPNTKEAAFRLLTDLNVLPKNSSAEQTMLTAQRTSGDQAGIIEPELNLSNKAKIQTEITKMLTASQIIKLPDEIVALSKSLSGLTQTQTRTEDIQLLKNLIDQMGAMKTSPLEAGNEVKQLFKHMIQLMGVEHEKDVTAFTKIGSDAPEKVESLKSLLISASYELGSNSKELEPLLHRLTGIQLLSQESNGPLQQLYMQFPVSLGNKLSDVTLQWSGRKNKDGQIDPSFCRILFYLDLENINETVIDMQVQNRVISISIINDTDQLETSVGDQHMPLKEQLAALDYVLSSVIVSNSSVKKELTQLTAAKYKLQQEKYQGVDIKI
ncbi:hypothetical protein [Bacillus sp. AK128]